MSQAINVFYKVASSWADAWLMVSTSAKTAIHHLDPINSNHLVFSVQMTWPNSGLHHYKNLISQCIKEVLFRERLICAGDLESPCQLL